MSSELPVVEEKTSCPVLTFEEQTEKLLISCTVEQLEYLSNAIYNEKEYRKFSESRIHLLREKLKQIEKDFDKKMQVKKQLLAAKFINEEVEDESEEESEEVEVPPSKKRKNSPSKKNTRKSK